jgi:serine protease Do
MSIFDHLKRQKFLSFTVVMLTLCIGVLIGTLLNTGVKAARESVAPGATPLAIPAPSVIQNSFSQLAKQLEPSVVNISSEYIPKTNVTQNRNQSRRPLRVVPQDPDDQGGDQQQDQGGMEDFLRRFFNNPNGQQMPQESQRGASLGSGFVVSSNGYILTNNHVVERANRIRVKFNGDQTEYDAKVIGTDWQTDLAVIKIDRTNLIPVRMGNSDSIQVGDWAIAIGSPFGFQETVTAGIISAKSRDIPGDSTTFQHFLQTDAAINPGNSGGPLLNINGEVIGINTQIASRSGGYQGIGFAMPSNTAVKVYNQIIKTGKVTRGSIGISFQANTAQIRELLKAYGAKNGVFVMHVEPGGPADKAGLKEQDIITQINGQKIETGNDLIDIVADTPIGQSMRVDYLRDGKPAQTEVAIADRSKVFPKEAGAPEVSEDNGNGGGDEATQARFGISIQNLNDKLKQNLGVKENGVVVQSVEPGSFAEDMGLVQGDVITQLNRKPITSVDQFKSIQTQLHTGDAVALRVLRSAGGGRQGGGEWQTLYLAGTVPAAAQ